eukprot:3422913-Pyramimonas_sp.AAC.1
MPLASAPRPHMYGEYPTAWVFDENPTTEEEACGYMNVPTSLTRDDWALEQRRRKGMYGTTLSESPGILGERHELALAANSGTMEGGMLTILLDIGSNINIIGLKTAQTFEQVSCSHGHDIKKLNLAKRLYVSGVGHGAAVCDKSLHCKIVCNEKRRPGGDTYCAEI